MRKDYVTSVSIFGRSLANARFAVARTVQRHTSGYAAPEALYAVGVGCDVIHARAVD